MNIYFDTEHFEYLTEGELLAEFNDLSKNGETEAQSYYEYVLNCTDGNGTLQPLNESRVVDRLQEMCTRYQAIPKDISFADAQKQFAAILMLIDAISRAENE
jgi:hypothetical protein